MGVAWSPPGGGEFDKAVEEVALFHYQVARSHWSGFVDMMEDAAQQVDDCWFESWISVRNFQFFYSL